MDEQVKVQRKKSIAEWLLYGIGGIIFFSWAKTNLHFTITQPIISLLLAVIAGFFFYKWREKQPAGKPHAMQVAEDCIAYYKRYGGEDKVLDQTEVQVSEIPGLNIVLVEFPDEHLLFEYNLLEKRIQGLRTEKLSIAERKIQHNKFLEKIADSQEKTRLLKKKIIELGGDIIEE